MNVYDFDKTIYDGDSTANFYLFAMKRHKRIIFLGPSLLGAVMKFYVFKKGTKTQFKEVMYRFLRYCDIEKDVADYWDINVKKIKRCYLKQQRPDDVVISASSYFLLKPVCDRLGIKSLIASNVDPRTGKYIGDNCHGKEKVRRFREKFGEVKIEAFYSDSHSDDPMAEIAEKAYLIKGEEIHNWND